MSKIELFRLTVTVIDKYNEELEKGYPESYLIPDKSLQALDRKIDEFLEKPICGKANEANAIHCYRRKQLPQDGYLDVNVEFMQIIKLLRAFDYGPLQIVPKLKVQLEGKTFEIEKYRIIVDGQVKWGKRGWISNYFLHRDGIEIELYIKKEE